MSARRLFYTDPVDANPVNQTESLKDLVADMRGGKVDILVILGGNPAYDAPADFGFADALKSTEHPAARSPRSLPERDCRTLPVACERGALSRSLGRRPRL